MTNLKTESNIKFDNMIAEMNKITKIESEEFEKKDLGRYLLYVVTRRGEKYKRLCQGKWVDNVDFSCPIFQAKNFRPLKNKMNELEKLSEEYDFTLNKGTKHEVILPAGSYRFELKKLIPVQLYYKDDGSSVSTRRDEEGNIVHRQYGAGDDDE